MALKKKVVMIGVDPFDYDYANSPFPDLTPEIVMDALKADEAKLNALGCDARLLLVNPAGEMESTVAAYLDAESFDCILIGAAARTTPKYFLLFEKLINLVHRHAPNAAICFNSNPDDTAAAVQRWV